MSNDDDMPPVAFGMTVPLGELSGEQIRSLLPYEHVGMLPFHAAFTPLMKAIMASGTSLTAAVCVDGQSLAVIDRSNLGLGSVVFLIEGDSIEVVQPKNKAGSALAKRVIDTIEAYLADPDNTKDDDVVITPNS